jgi:hypothetical protein
MNLKPKRDQRTVVTNIKVNYSLNGLFQGIDKQSIFSSYFQRTTVTSVTISVTAIDITMIMVIIIDHAVVSCAML